MTISIAVPSQSQLDEVRALMRAFVQWHRARHAQDIQLIDQYFDAAAFDEELRALPGFYAPPTGQLLLATCDAMASGCVALRGIDARSCEMKRMFVYERFHGQGLGRALGERIIEQACSLGYRRMLLDTSIRQDEAIGLYSKLGFKIIEPYYELPDEMRNWLVFMELKLPA